VNVPIPDWATKIQTEVQSALVKNPDANYVIPFVDGMSQFALAGITAAGKTGKVKISTFNGTPFALKLIQDGNVLAMDVGENLDWLGWADMDQALRLLVGAKPVQERAHPASRLRQEQRLAGRYAAEGLDRLRHRVRREVQGALGLEVALSPAAGAHRIAGP
jgi:ABC-type sugar transport system substrate-binding protein